MDVARFWGVAERTVMVWRAAGMPGRSKRYHLAEIARWRVKHLELGRQTPPPDVDEDGIPTDPARREKFYKAALAALSYERERGNLVAKSECEKQLLARSQWFSDVIRQFAPQLASQLVNKSRRACQKIIAAHAREVLKAGFGEREDR